MLPPPNWVRGGGGERRVGSENVMPIAMLNRESMVLRKGICLPF